MSQALSTIGTVFLWPFRFLATVGRWLRRAIGGLLTSFRFWILFCLAAIVALLAYYVVADRLTPLTTDAYVQAYVVQVAPQVGGQVVRVYVQEGQEVARGELLFELDARPFEHRVALLEAKLVEAERQVKQLTTAHAAARAEHRRLEAEAAYARSVYEQEEVIFKKQSTTERKYLDALQKHRAAAAAVERSVQMVQQAEDAVAARIGDEHALIAEARAQLKEARLNLEYCRVLAPCDGVITNLQVREGTYAQVGEAVLACIDSRHWMVIANFRENSLEFLEEGLPGLVAFQALPGRLLSARVEYLGWGVGQGQGVPSGRLPEVKELTRWIPASQRFQVRLRLDQPPPIPLRVGMTASVSVYVDDEQSVLNRLTRGIHQWIAWFYYL